MDAVGNPSRMGTDSVSKKQGSVPKETHTLWRLNMLNQHDQLLLTDETLKSRVEPIIRVLRNDLRTTSKPLYILRLREQLFHQSLLAGKLDLNMALTKATSTTTSTVCLEAVDGADGLGEAGELNVAVKSLACDALHDYVDWLVLILVDDTGIATKEGHYFGAGNTVWNLQVLSEEPCYWGRWKLTFLILITPHLSGLGRRQYSAKGKFLGSRASSTDGFRVLL
jgi:hypothetical protein